MKTASSIAGLAAVLAAATLMEVFTASSLWAAQFSSQDYAVGHLPVAVVVHDFNGDGKPDLAVLNAASGDVSVLLNYGTGSFQSIGNFTVSGANPGSIAVGDFDGDGKLDLAVGLPSSTSLCSGSSVNILFGIGDGTFRAAAQAFAVASNSVLVASGDVNGDGRADIVIQRLQADSSCTPPPGTSVFIGNGDGTFQAEKDINSAPFDINGDGITDLLDTSPLNVFLGQANGQFRPLQAGPEGDAGSLTIGDFNGDRKTDEALIAFTCSGIFSCPQNGWGFVTTTLGNGDGTFQPGQSFPLGGYSFYTDILGLAPADINLDGKLDVALIRKATPGFTVLLGKGDGTLPASLSFNTGSGPGNLVVSDLNGDGRPDIVAVNLNDDTVSIALNTLPSSGADLALQLGATPNPVSVSQSLIYVLTLQNFGPQDATNVVLTDNLPSSVSFGSVVIDHGSCIEAQLVVTCTIAKLVSGDSAIATITVTPIATGNITDSASLTASETDTNTANNSATNTTHVDPLFTLTVNRMGGGIGTVTGGGINCGSVCSVSLPTGTAVNLQVAPTSGSGFGGWGGACAQNFLAGGCDLTMSANQTVTAEFDLLPDFAFAGESNPVIVQAGQTATASIIVLPEGASFPNPVTLSCTVQGKAATAPPLCSLSPASLTLPDSNGAAATLSIATTARSAVARMRSTPAGIQLALWMPFAIVLGGMRTRSRSLAKKRPLLPSLNVVLLLVLCLQLACGRGDTPKQVGARGTAAGMYTVTVTGTSGSLKHSTQVSVMVQ